MLLALVRRRIAHPKAHDYVDFQNEITAGIYDRRNGVLGISGHCDKSAKCPLLTGDLNRSMQHWEPAGNK
jgi:hypothetical protein